MECAARGMGTTCVPGPPTRRCGLCGVVAYCSVSHQVSHWNDHKEECSRLEQQMRCTDVLNDFPFTFSLEATSLVAANQKTRCSFLMSRGLHHVGLWKSVCDCGPPVASINDSCINDDWNLSSALCPCTEPRSPLSTCLKSWKDYYQWRCLPFHSPVALLLHWPLTIYHCFQLASIQNLISAVNDKLIIHYLGADKELLELAVFGELLALFPGVQLYINFVGPAVPQFRDCEKLSICSYACCSEEGCVCKHSSMNPSLGVSTGMASTLTLQLHKGFYHDRYRDILKVSFPQLIVAPNSGIAAYSSWLPTLEVIQEMGVPAIFSDFCEEAAHLGAGCMKTVTGRSLRFPIQINPFRQPMEVEDNALYLPCYSNCFLFGI